jgi:hypothetical protein
VQAGNLTPEEGRKYFLDTIKAQCGGSVFARYADDPIAFAHDVLGIKYLCDHQQEFHTATVEHERVARRTGHGISKTFDASITTLHRLYTREAIVVTTAPTWHQVELLLWKEIGKMHRAAKNLPGTLLNTRINLGDRYAVGRSTDDPNKFQGFHDKEVVIIEDESPGVHPSIHPAIEGTMTAGGLWVKQGNPTEASGHFYAVFQDDMWHKMHMSSWDHPNVSQDKIIIPGAVTRKWCEERKRKWGEDSPLYQSRVLGDFPTEGIDQVVRLVDIEAALVRGAPGTGNKEIWCDVARFGDDETVIGLKHGLKYTELLRYNGKDTTQTIGHCIRLADIHQAVAIGVDDDGVGGGVSDGLIAHYGNDMEIIMYRGGESANDSEHFENRRGEAWWSMRDTIKNITIEADDADDLKAQFTSTKRQMTRKGKIKMMSKEDMRKAGDKSPDRADVIVMAFAPRGASLWIA